MKHIHQLTCRYKVLRMISGPSEDSVTGQYSSYTLSSFIICINLIILEWFN
jgi:hypothetical protein